MTAMHDTRNSAGLRKAAIVVSSLDADAADFLLDQLGPERAALVRQAVMAIDDFDVDEQRRVLDEFRRIGPMVPAKCPPGIELDSLEITPATRLRDQTSAPCSPTNFSVAALPDPDAPFGFLRDSEEAQLLELLAGERPKTIALVLAHLPPERSGEVLARLDGPRQAEVVRGLVDLDAADPEVVREVEESLEARWSRQFAAARRRAAGPEAVARILAMCDGRVVEDILDNLAAYDRPLAERLGGCATTVSRAA
jgi:flagellar motor switch protein FliG